MINDHKESFDFGICPALAKEKTTTEFVTKILVVGKYCINSMDMESLKVFSLCHHSWLRARYYWHLIISVLILSLNHILSNECHCVGFVAWGLGTIFDHNINLIMQQNISLR